MSAEEIFEYIYSQGSSQKDKSETILKAKELLKLYLKNGEHLTDNIWESDTSLVKQKNTNWKFAVDAWFNFYKLKYNQDPTFTPVAQGSLKKIVGELKRRAEKQDTEFTDEYCYMLLYRFFEVAHTIEFINKNFVLQIVWSRFDAVLSKARESNLQKIDYSTYAPIQRN